MKKQLLTITLTFMTLWAVGQTGISPYNYNDMYGKKPKNDTVSYAIEVLMQDNTYSPTIKWFYVSAVRHYELLPFDCGMNFCQKWTPKVDYYIWPKTKNKFTLPYILRAVEIN